ncbi:hypothetical protein ACJMK2_007534 [Sinanodonta woodiana]|uniref:Nonsense-mediated mRNA decay factor SMG8 n=1 Tax=Sinanodonta woodiana TaxID=1069815 RepID=A0ABD3VLU3_SINWO
MSNMSGMYKALPFPPESNLFPLKGRDNKVIIVSIIGKSSYNHYTSKASHFNTILDADAFKGVQEANENEIKGKLEYIYDPESQVVYLHYHCLYDAERLTVVCQRLAKESQHKDFHSFLQQEDFHQAKIMLFLFNVSHIIVLSSPSSSFDISYVRLFRSLDAIRMKLQKCLSEQLLGFPISKDWVLGGRPCSPRVLFVFERATIDCSSEDADTSSASRSRSQKIPPIKRLQHAIEDQIYKILRKSRVITNISNNSLFAVPANQEFVYVHCKQNEMADPTSYYLNQLRHDSSSPKDSDSLKSRSYQTNRRSFLSGSGLTEGLRLSSSPRNGGENSFKEFLCQHVELALTKGFDDNVGRHPVPAIFEITTCETWFTIATKLYEYFFAEKLDPKAQPHLNTLKSLLETETRFSENRCNKVLPLAESAYQENLPQHYVLSYHLSKLAQAKKVFSQFARGPSCDKYIAQLEESCVNFWKNGRQLCEEISLTGNHCVNPLHRNPEEHETEGNMHLPIMPHTSQLKMKAACNCGRKQADKDDPFDHKAANFDFYDALDKICCKTLQHISFPVFEPSTTEIRAGQSLSSPSVQSTSLKISSRSQGREVHSEKDIVLGMSNLSLVLSLGQSGGGSDLYNNTEHSIHAPQHSIHQDLDQLDHNEESLIPTEQELEQEMDHVHIENQEEHQEYQLEHEPDESPHNASRQHSTTEYLPGMIHSESPSGLLPTFPSWSLCSLGKASTYNHTQGMDLPGFLSGSNFLLPYDITVRAEKDKWPSVGETVSKKGKQKRATKEISEVNCRVFIGEEYECPRGHRFFCSGPEKIIKVSSTSTVKDNANKLVNLDMPLYCPCHCRSSKGYMAQMMRIYIVVPEGPVKMFLNPRVQPVPQPCILFRPEVEEPIELPNGQIWVLRLPHIYLGEHGAYTMPTDPQLIPQCRLLKGVFCIKELMTID